MRNTFTSLVPVLQQQVVRLAKLLTLRCGR